MKIQDVNLPPLLYGTAWKEEATTPLVRAALKAGFRGIDTANQRKHYFEAGVGAALKDAGIAREELFLQTKFTYVDSQDSRLPYDPSASYEEQVRQSFESSLEHLGVTFLDSLVLHGPQSRRGLTDGDRQVWRTMESLHDEGKVRLIGVSNASAEQLATFCTIARVRPSFIQNRCYAALGWDRDVRSVCANEGVIYQGFSLLTANRRELGSAAIRAIAATHMKSVPQVIFRFALQLGMLPLTGTTDPHHMRDDLNIFDFELTPEEMATIETISG